MIDRITFALLLALIVLLLPFEAVALALSSCRQRLGNRTADRVR